MLIRSIMIGIVTTLALVTLLVVSRLLGNPEVPSIELTPVETAELEQSSPPPDFTEPEDPDDTPPPPTPKLDLTLHENVDAPEIPLSLQRVDLKTPIQAFQTDNAPAALPTIRKAQTEKKKIVAAKQRPSTPRRKPPVKKSYYSMGELDSLPRQIRTGRFTWPARAKGSEASVRLLIEINRNGSVQVIRVVSSTNSSLNYAAEKVAKGSKFTAPRKNGQKVKARFYKTYQLRKP